MWPWKDRVKNDLVNLQKMSVSTGLQRASPGLCNVPLQAPHPALQPLWNVASLLEVFKYLKAESFFFGLLLPLSVDCLCHLYVLRCVIGTLPPLGLMQQISNGLPCCALGFSLLLTFWGVGSEYLDKFLLSVVRFLLWFPMNWWFPTNASCLYSSTVQPIYTVVGRRRKGPCLLHQKPRKGLDKKGCRAGVGWGDSKKGQGLLVS